MTPFVRKPGSWVRIPLRAWMFGVCVCAFFCVGAQIETLRLADHPPKESYRVSLVNRSETESFVDVGQGQNWGCSAKGKKKSMLYTGLYQFRFRCSALLDTSAVIPHSRPLSFRNLGINPYFSLFRRFQILNIFENCLIIQLFEVNTFLGVLTYGNYLNFPQYLIFFILKIIQFH
jgi:hypothetical protein